MCGLAHYNLASVAKALNCELAVNDDVFSGISIDTRTLKPGELFVALVGPNFDGHEYLQVACDKGAVAAIVSRKIETLSLPQIQVNDTRLALAEMAKARREAFDGRVVALTGSNGKTTVKELIAAVLKRKGKVLATQGNFNNEIGLPLTLLDLQNDETFAVIEMGANHFGEIEFLTSITRPDIALITNAGAAHLDGFGDVKGVANAKAEIFSGLSDDGVAIINADDEYAEYWQEKTKNFKQLLFGIDAKNADIKAQDVKVSGDGTAFLLQTPLGSIPIQLSIGGKHNVANVLAAAAVAYLERIDLQDVKRAIEAFLPVKGRLNFLKSSGKATIIDDTYNANFDSTIAAIGVLSSLQGEKILVLGDMLESGESAVKLHEDVGHMAKKKGIDELLGFGELSRAAVSAFNGKAQHFTDKISLIEYMKTKLKGETTVLIKGSRGMQMDLVVSQLI